MQKDARHAIWTCHTEITRVRPPCAHLHTIRLDHHVRDVVLACEHPEGSGPGAGHGHASGSSANRGEPGADNGLGRQSTARDGGGDGARHRGDGVQVDAGGLEIRDGNAGERGYMSARDCGPEGVCVWGGQRPTEVLGVSSASGGVSGGSPRRVAPVGLARGDLGLLLVSRRAGRPRSDGPCGRGPTAVRPARGGSSWCLLRGVTVAREWLAP